MSRAMVVILAAMMFGAAPLEPERMPATPAPAPATQSVRFTTVDIRIDPKGKPLAAYQLEFVVGAGVKLAGIEGGDHAAFTAPPYYDPSAMSRNRVIIAALNTGPNLPSAAFRAARLHVQVNADESPDWQVKLIVASAADGSAIPATATLAEGAQR
jgi:hypothetical protein